MWCTLCNVFVDRWCALRTVVHVTHHPNMNRSCYRKIQPANPLTSFLINRLEDFAVPFSFDPDILSTKAMYDSAFAFLEDPTEGGCHPLDMLDLLNRIVAETKNLRPACGSSLEIAIINRHSESNPLIVVLVRMPMNAVLLVTPSEAVAMTEIGIIDTKP